MVVVYMDAERKHVAPKQERGVFMNQRYILQFDPNAPPDCRWVWIVHYRREFEFVGSAPTIDAALRMAKRRIKELSDGHAY